MMTTDWIWDGEAYEYAEIEAAVLLYDGVWDHVQRSHRAQDATDGARVTTEM